MSWFDQREDGIGTLASMINSHTKDLEASTALPLGMATRDILTSLSCLSMSFYSSWKLTAVMLATMPIIAILVPLFSARIQPNIEAQTIQLGTATKHATNAFSVLDTVKCYNGQLQEQQRYKHAIKQAASCYYRQITWHAGQTAVLRFITLGMFVQGFWYGSTLIIDDANSAGRNFTAFWSCLLATSSLMAIVPHIMELEKGKMAGAQLCMMLAVSSQTLSPRFGQLQASAHDITFKNVWFSYPAHPDRMVLKGIDLSFLSGKMTFVTGRSGSGKSTLGQLIIKFYAPSDGIVAFGELEVQTISCAWIRNNALLVEQNSVLFNTTIKENIALGKRDPASIAFKEVEEAAEFASIKDAIEDMPDGFNTLVGSEGAALSGGQVQRVALARARLRDPPILILDEPTSALDQVNRLAVVDAIREWRKGKTTIIITHDVSQIRPDDFVYVLEDGKVAEEGLRKALSKTSNSLFQELVKSSRPSRQADRFTGTTLATLSEIDKRYAEHQDVRDELYPMRPFSELLPEREWSTMRRSSRWATALESPLLSGWAPRTSTVIPQPQVTRRSVVHLSPRSPNSPDLNWGGQSRVGSPRLAQSYRAIGPELRDISSIQPRNDSPQYVVEEPRSVSLGKSVEVQRQCPPDYTTKSILATVWPTLASLDRAFLVAGLAAAIIFAASTPVFAFSFSKLLRTFYDPVEHKAMALKYSLVVLAIAAGDAFTLFVAFSLIQRVGQSWVNTFREKALARILDQPRDFFEQDENGISRMISCFDHHAEEMQHMLGRFAGNMVIVITTVVVAITWSLTSCWKLTLVMLACTPVVIVIIKSLKNVAGTIEAQIADEEEQAASIFAEAFNSIKTVRTLTLEDWFRMKHQRAVAAVLKTGFKEGIYVGTFFGLSQGALLFLTAIVFHYGGVLLYTQQVTFEDIMQVITLLLFSISTATSTMASIPKLTACRESASRLLRLVNLPQVSHESDGNEKIESVDDIVFQNVHFRYPSRTETLVLRDLNLQIRQGNSIAIVGASGSGKSTIASLLLKLYPAQPSAIKISGHKIEGLETRTLRRLVAMVSQTLALFPTSISANIVYGLPRSDPLNDPANVRAAATAAGIHDFVSSLPNGYDTVIGEGGMGLSGGQAQRIAVARALARQPHVLILDEATSALDQESAGVIRESISGLRKRQRDKGEKVMTVIVITHCREMMQMCDRVVMLDRGRVVEDGGYEELLKMEGQFAGMMRGEVWKVEREGANKGV
ncbi:hypothetical protein FKW77_001642 [Venturia effusa]|uniref:Uncharacterized protein n=1 Tax=Venturia effusa TaxID=50376 RepID=A0A517KZ36_9PEZI|nr:hypothetical protein FKW77_001642 [Venturia effusa]